MNKFVKLGLGTVLGGGVPAAMLVSLVFGGKTEAPKGIPLKPAVSVVRSVSKAFQTKPEDVNKPIKLTAKEIFEESYYAYQAHSHK